MRRRRRAPLAIAAALLAVAGCGTANRQPTAAGPSPSPVASPPSTRTPGGCSGFALELAPHVTGQPSPVAAATWFAEHGGVANLPESGWRAAGNDELGVTVRSGPVTLHLVRLPDGTWYPDSGQWC